MSRRTKPRSKPLSPAFAAVVILVVLAIVVVAVTKFGNGKNHDLKQTPEMQQIQNEVNTAIKHIDPSRTRMGGVSQNTNDTLVTPSENGN